MVVITVNRPECVRVCLEHLARQIPRAAQTIVVDASTGPETEVVVRSFPGVVYLRHEDGLGRMTASRNIALRHVSSEIVAFVDDDAYVHDGWTAALVASFAPGVGAVGGRALRGPISDGATGLAEIGQLRPDGTITGGFDADPGAPVDVDHVIGCNMAFRRDVLAVLGGFREDYKGVSGVREDSDVCFRVRRLGHRIIFNPAAVVTHVGAPQAVGQRFDVRYTYYAQRNHCVLLLRNFGLRAPFFRRFLLWSAKSSWADVRGRAVGREAPRALARALVIFTATMAGTFEGIVALLRSGTDPVRHDNAGRQLTRLLSEP